jgi:hypothetical protein
MVCDAEQRVAVVKWLAEFDNIREKRADKAEKRVRFVQIAKLHFEGNLISHLEEYAQSMGPHARWPSLESTSEQLWDLVRMAPWTFADEQGAPCTCERCGEQFASRTKLFNHLRESSCAPAVALVPTTVKQRTLCVTIAYQPCAEPVQEQLARALISLVAETCSGQHATALALSWAVPVGMSASAIVNVAAAHVPKSMLDRVPIEDLAARLNTYLCTSEANGARVVVHSCHSVDRPFTQNRREGERYSAFLPWALLGGSGAGMGTSSIPMRLPRQSVRAGLQPNGARAVWEETSAAAHVAVCVARRLKHAVRWVTANETAVASLLSMGKPGEIKRVRTSVMGDPWADWCRISVSMCQQTPGAIEQLITLIVVLARQELDTDSLSVDEIVGRLRRPLPAFPSEFTVLMSPMLTSYESKLGVSFCGEDEASSPAMKTSIDQAFRCTMEWMRSRERIVQEWGRSLDALSVPEPPAMEDIALNGLVQEAAQGTCMQRNDAPRST